MMRKVWSFLSDPSLHFLVVILALTALAIGSSGSEDPASSSVLAFCAECRTYHFAESPCSQELHNRIAQFRP